MRVTSWLSRPALLKTLASRMRLAVRLFREPAVALLAKAVPVLAVLYVVSPIDFVPDVIPVLGQLDDLAVVLIAIETFVSWCPRAAVDFHKQAIESGRRYSAMPATGQVIDAEFHRDQEF